MDVREFLACQVPRYSLVLVNRGNVKSVIVVMMEMWFFYRATSEKLEVPEKLAFKDSL